ncbi:4-(cytidine 5'-diphospho)-2-C-methyl-D-erythritol kinase [Sulfurimonas sp. HSL-1716]|uniref:4-(cytidine 5'-diphospho)-2-C-methyl-D-erythritol kinase n=1 Tax=Hydrocurvibacter sulfurireducens TaxID=3131937 RepID=UPI0031F9BD82
MKLYKACAKVNIFLKITGTRGDYHEILSRFMKIPSLYDELSFVPKTSEKFEITGNFNCETSQNTIYKAYMALKEYTKSESLTKLLRNYGVHVNKKIPSFAGLGGGSSDAATFLRMCNEVLHLGLSKAELAKIGTKVGADVPFFIYDYDSANVSGIGEIVEKFDEELLNLEVFTPDIEISTPKVYKTYRELYFDPIDGFKADKLKRMKSAEILKNFSIDEANDLFKPALHNYPKLKESYRQGYFFSGSGSSFFYMKEVKDKNG